MKKLMAGLAVLAVLVLPLMGFAGVAHAGNFRNGENVVVEQGEVVNGTLFASGNNLEIAGTVDGDIFCAGQTILVTGTVRGDVICAGQTVRIEGNVEGDVRLAGQNVTIAGIVDGNATVAAELFTLAGNGQVRDAAIAASVVTLNGEIGRDADLGAEQVNVNGSVGRNINADVEKLALGSGASVGGGVNYTSDNELSRATGAVVVGEINQEQPPDNEGPSVGQVLGVVFIIFLMLMTVSMAMAALFPRVLQRISDNAVESIGMTALIGLVVFILAPAVILILIGSIFGSLLGILLLLAYLLVLSASGPVFGYYIGRLLLRDRTANPLLYMALGSGLVTALYFVPFVGQVLLLVAGVFGTGMIVREVARRAANPSYDLSEKPAKRRWFSGK